MSKTQDRHFRPGVMLFPFRKYLSGAQHNFVQAYVKEGMYVLDMGSGPGFFTTLLSKSVGSNGSVYAVDADEVVIRHLKKQADMQGLTNIKAYASSAANIPFVRDGSIDVLFSNGLLCCMMDHKGAVREMIRVMKPDSKGFISVAKVLRNDGIGVTKKEWNEILGSFRTVKVGSSVMIDWAIVSKI